MHPRIRSKWLPVFLVVAHLCPCNYWTVSLHHTELGNIANVTAVESVLQSKKESAVRVYFSDAVLFQCYNCIYHNEFE